MRASEFIELINIKKLPDKRERLFLYTHLTFDDVVKKIRKEVRKQRRKDDKDKARIH